MASINQDKADFEAWLRSQPEDATAQAGNQCSCWLAQWFESQGVSVWGVFPQHYLEGLGTAPGSQEILLDDPDEPEFSEESDRIPLTEWACAFGREVDYQYHEPFQASTVTRDEALAVFVELEAVE